MLTAAALEEGFLLALLGRSARFLAVPHRMFELQRICGTAGIVGRAGHLHRLHTSSSAKRMWKRPRVPPWLRCTRASADNAPHAHGAKGWPLPNAALTQ